MKQGYWKAKQNKLEAEHLSGKPEFDSIQLSPEGEVNSREYIPRREASRYISTALQRT